MRPVSASVGISAGKATLVLLLVNNQKQRDGIRQLLKQMQDDGVIPRSSFAVATFADERQLLIVLPASSHDPEGMIKELTTRMAMDFSLHMRRAPMSADGYEALAALADGASSSD